MANFLLRRPTLPSTHLQQQAMIDNAPVGSVGAPGGLLGMAQGARRSNALNGLFAAGSLIPGVGDAVGLMGDAAMYASDPSSRTIPNYLLSAAGLLPFVPAMAGGKIADAIGGSMKQTGGHQEAAKQIAEALRAAKEADPYADYGLRVLPDSTANAAIGEVLGPSWRWIDGNQTDELLDGVSSIKIRGDGENAIMQALNNLGVMGKQPHETPNGVYRGPRVALLKGESTGAGEDVGESVIDKAKIIDLWDRAKEGWGEILAKPAAKK